MSGVRSYRNGRYPNQYWRNVPAYGLSVLGATLGQANYGQYYEQAYDSYFNAKEEFGEYKYGRKRVGSAGYKRRIVSSRPRVRPTGSYRRRVKMFKPRRRRS